MKRMVLLINVCMALCVSLIGVVSAATDTQASWLTRMNDHLQRVTRHKKYFAPSIGPFSKIDLGTTLALIAALSCYWFAGNRIKLLEQKIKEADDENELTALRKTLSSYKIRRRWLLAAIAASIGANFYADGYHKKKEFGLKKELEKLCAEGNAAFAAGGVS